jgi:transcriptional regulator with XRE-family HTH domain
MANLKSYIGARVRELRQARRWTQRELSARLGLSQSRLSQIEHGQGSFTAEQFLTLLRLFNVGVDDFVPVRTTEDRSVELQNALARLGARHLRESENVFPPTELDDAEEVVRQTLIAGAPRLVAALAPVLVDHFDYARLLNLDASLSETGHERRLGWAVENIVGALEDAGRIDISQRRQRKLRRAQFVLEHYLKFAAERETARPRRVEDLLDLEVRSDHGLEAVRSRSSPISRRWGMITSVQPSDFTDALRAAYAAD